MSKVNPEHSVTPDNDVSGRRTKSCDKYTLASNKQPYDEKELRSFLHDLHGPLACALGFTEELAYVRQSMQNLVKDLEKDIDSEILSSLRHQINEEMEHCLSRVNSSLTKLDAIIESMRTDTKSND